MSTTVLPKPPPGPPAGKKTKWHVVIAVASTIVVTPRHGLAYDPSTDRWSALPMAPLRGRTDAGGVWTGNQMIVWGGMSVGDLTTVLTDGAAYTP